MKDRIRALLLKSLLRMLSWLPLRLAHGLGAGLGAVIYRYARKTTRIVRRNLELCFPGLPADQREALIKAALQETGKSLTELGALWFWRPERTLALITEISGQDLLEAALAQGRGVIIAGPHLGAWELLGLYLPRLRPITNLYRPPRLAPLDPMMRRARQRSGAQLVPTDTSGVRALLEGLKRGELVGILPDQDPGFGNGVFAPFFGIPTNTMTLLARLAHKSGAAVFLGYAERLPGGTGYHLHFIPAPADIGSRDTHLSATHLNTAIESAVRAHPTQYQWSYKRFKTRPEGEPGVY
ncbi:MAG: lysophospholipid acyltransferase family protein [Pseudomonadota bacterium]